MRRHSLTLPVLSLLFLLFCAGGAASALGMASGNGQVGSETRRLTAFSAIDLSGVGDLRVEKGAAFAVEIRLDSNLLPHFRSEVEGGRLVLGFEPGFGVLNITKLEIRVTLPALEGVAISGSGDAVIAKGFAGNRLRLEINGSGSIEAEGVYREIALSVSGSGEVKLAGSAVSLSIEISGSGSVEGKALSALEARVVVSGSGDVALRVSRKLTATVSGAGDIRYWGDPTVDARSSGSGSVKRAGS